jgi:uncharacterized cupredoxin-like copper-binding protein
MEFPTDERAQAIQIGAVLLFGILILFLSLYQAVVVPDQNEEIEFNHNEDLQQQLTELRSTVILMPGSTSTRAASLDLGVRYPSRAIFVNPGPASGTLRTVGTENSRVNVTITNASAVDDAGETRDFWNGTALSFETGAIEYRPGYNLYQGAPRTVYEHSVLYNAFERENVTQAVAGQTLVEGSRITVIALDGSLTENRVDTLSLDVDPISTRTRVVELNGTAEPVTLRMPTGMSEDEWNKTFEDELVPNGHVQDVSVSPGGPGGLGLLEVTLEAGERYQLELAKVGVGTGATGTDAAYLTDVAGNGTTLEPGDTTQLTVEARDRFNGPESGVTVTAAAENGTIPGGTTETTDNEGRASFEYQPTGAGTNRVNFTIDPAHNPSGADDAGSPRNVTMLVEVEAPAEDDGGGPVAYNTTWLDPNGQPGTKACDNETCTFNYSKATTLNLTANTDPTADDVRVDFGVEDRSVGRVNPSQPSTGSNGQATTTFRPQDNGTVNVYAWSGGSGDAIEIEVIEYQPGGFQVAVDDFDDPVTEGENVTVDVTIENTGSETDTQTIDLNVDNDQDGSFDIDADEETDVELDPGESRSVTLTYTTQTGDAPEIDFEVLSDDDREERTVTVNAPAFFDVNVTDTNSPVTEGETLEVDVNVTNTGDNPDTQTLNLTDTGFTSAEQDTVDVSLAPGAYNNSITLEWPTSDGDAGSGNVTVFSENTSNAAAVTVQEPPFFDVEITGTNSPVTETDTLTVDVNVTNTGGVQDTQTLNLTDTGFNNAEQDTVDVTLAAGVYNNSITLEWPTSDGDTGTGNVTVFSENDSDLTEVTVEAANGLTGTGVTDIVGNANKQMQAFQFTLTDELGEDETVTISLENPQDSGNVDYQNEDAQLVVGDGQIDNFDASADELVYQAPDSGYQGDVEIWVNNVIVDGEGGPFDVDLTRSDRSESETADFAVTRNGDAVELSTFEVSDLTVTSPREQTITFEPDGDFGSKERVSIDLTDAQAGSVNYGEDVAVTGGSGEAEMKVVDNEDVVYVTYTAPDGGFGDEVELTLSEVTPTGTGGTYEVGVSRGSAGTDSTMFDVRLSPWPLPRDGNDDMNSTTFDVQEPPFFEVEITDTNSPVTEGETLTVDVNVTNTGDVSDTQTLNLTDSGFNGTERNTEDVTLAGGESDDSITLEWETSGGDAGSGSVAVFSDNDSDAETVTVDAQQASFVQRVPGSTTAPGGVAPGSCSSSSMTGVRRSSI